MTYRRHIKDSISHINYGFVVPNGIRSLSVMFLFLYWPAEVGGGCHPPGPRLDRQPTVRI